MRQCTACLQTFPATLEYFRASPLGRYGLYSRCRACHNANRLSTKPKAPAGLKRCYKCGRILPIGEFQRNRRTKDGLQARCRHCGRTYEQNFMTPERKRAKILRRHGITPSEYDRLFLNQQGLCAACGNKETRINPLTGNPIPLSVDHDHETGRIRALLCHGCNAALGHLKEDVVRIRALLAYAEWCQAYREIFPHSDR